MRSFTIARSVTRSPSPKLEARCSKLEAVAGTSSPFVYPVHVAIARHKSGTERVIVIDAYRS
jgi:hypothetical protein